VTAMAGPPAAELWYPAFCQAVSVADPDQPLKAPKATNTVSASFPSVCVRF